MTSPGVWAARSGTCSSRSLGGWWGRGRRTRREPGDWSASAPGSCHWRDTTAGLRTTAPPTGLQSAQTQRLRHRVHEHDVLPRQSEGEHSLEPRTKTSAAFKPHKVNLYRNVTDVCVERLSGSDLKQMLVGQIVSGVELKYEHMIDTCLPPAVGVDAYKTKVGLEERKISFRFRAHIRSHL